VSIETESEIHDIDSAYGSDSETEAVDPSRSLYFEANGRTYHTFGTLLVGILWIPTDISAGCTKYWGPNDERACEVLELGYVSFYTQFTSIVDRHTLVIRFGNKFSLRCMLHLSKAMVRFVTSLVKNSKN
jgi:hypothetical protein